MFEGRSVFVVVPAYNEEKLIGTVVATMPGIVDRIIIVDDASTDGTAAALESMVGTGDPRLRVIRRPRNGGVGAAIVTGYKAALEEARDNALVVVMAGDAQMDPDDLPRLLAPSPSTTRTTPRATGSAAGRRGRSFPATGTSVTPPCPS